MDYVNGIVMEKNLQIEIMSSYFIQFVIHMLSTIKSKLGVGGDSPPDDKPRKPGGRGGYTTTLIESLSWQPLYGGEVFGFLLSLTVDKSSLSGFTASWKPVIGTLVVGWVIRTLYNPEQPLFNRMDAQQSGENHLAIITYPKEPQKSETVAVGGTESGTSGARGNGGGVSGTSVTFFSHDNDGSSGDQPPQTFYHTRGPSCPHPHCNNGRCIEIRVEGEEVVHSCVAADSDESGGNRLVDSQVYSTPFDEIDMAQFLLIGMDLLKTNEAGQEDFTEIVNNAIDEPGTSIGVVLDRLSHLVVFPQSRITQLLPVESGSSYSGREIATRGGLTRGSDSNYAGLSSASRSTVNELEHAVRILIKGRASERLRSLVLEKANEIIRQLVDLSRNDPDESFKNKIVAVARIINEANENGVGPLMQELDTGVNITHLAEEFSGGESWLADELQRVIESVLASFEKLGIAAEKILINKRKDLYGHLNYALTITYWDQICGFCDFYYFFSEQPGKENFIRDHGIDMEVSRAFYEWNKRNRGNYLAKVAVTINAKNLESSSIEVLLKDRFNHQIHVKADGDEGIKFVDFIDMTDGKPKAKYKEIFKKLDEIKTKLNSAFGSSSAPTRGSSFRGVNVGSSEVTEVPEEITHYSDVFDEYFNKQDK